MITLLLENPLLLLFVVAGIGYPLGRIKIGGTSLGVAAVLFVGLGFGALHPDLKLPEIVYLLGLVLFVYTIGLSSGPGFFRSLRGSGLGYNVLVFGIISLTAGLAVVGARLLGLPGTTTAGMFAGTLTNTPALAGVLEYLKHNAPADAVERLVSEPVVAYSLAYPVSVLGMIMTIYLAQRLWRVDYAREAQQLRKLGATSTDIQNRTILVTRPEAADVTIQELVRHGHWEVIVGRIKHNRQLGLARAQTRIAMGDLLSVVGTPEELDRVTYQLGEPSSESLDQDLHEIDYRRIFVSSHRVAGRRLRDLQLPQRFDAIVTRVRRGDIELLPDADMVLELGDRVRVVARREQMSAVTSFFGDSYRALSEIDIATFSLGIALGLLLGSIPIPLPGGVVLKLGFAGGPLVAALVLSAVERTGRIVWALPYSANLMLRQFGLILFLAGIGTRSGYAFAQTLIEGNGWLILLASAALIAVTGVTLLWIGHRFLKIPFGLLLGIAAGLQTQPAVLGYALEQTNNELPNIGYATVFPVAMITKIVLAQVVLTYLL